MTSESFKEKIRTWLDFIIPRSAEERLLDNIDVSTFCSIAKTTAAEKKDLAAIFDYRDPLVKKLIWLLKFKGDKKRAKLVASIMHDHILAAIQELSLFGDFSKPLIIPVPLSEKRKRERGFNQCELIARQLEILDGNANFEIGTAVLVKIIDTRSQTSLSPAQRSTNLRNCFELNDKAVVAGRNVIIIDDVFTTGSTMEEIKRVLQKAGAKKIIGLTFAH